LLCESFTLVRALGLRKIGEGGGTEHEDINVHLVAREDIPAFVAARRAEGMAVDVKLLIFMQF
jgi:ADP-ribose pyrophosphatase